MDPPGVWEGERNANLIRTKFDELYSKHFQYQHTVLPSASPNNTPVLPHLIANPTELSNQSPSALNSPQLFLFNRPREEPRSQAAGLAEPNCDPDRHEDGVKAVLESSPLGNLVQENIVFDGAVALEIDCKQTPAKLEELLSEGFVREGLGSKSLESKGLVGEHGVGLRPRTRSSRKCKCCAVEVNGQSKVRPANGAKKRSGPHRMSAKASLETGSEAQWGHDVPGTDVLVWPTNAARSGKREERRVVKAKKAEKVDRMLGRRAPRRGSGLGDMVKAACVATKFELENLVKQRDLVGHESAGRTRVQKGASVFLPRNLRFGHRKQEGSARTGRLDKLKVSSILVKGPTQCVVSGAESSKKRARELLTSASLSTDSPSDSSSPVLRSKRTRSAAENPLDTDASVSDHSPQINPLESAPPVPALSVSPTNDSVLTRQTRLKQQRRSVSQTEHSVPAAKKETPVTLSSENSPVMSSHTAPKRVSKRRGSSQQGGGEPLVTGTPAEGAAKSAALKRSRKEMKVAGDTGRPICRICRAEYDEGRCYLACDFCDRWYHADAFGVTPEKAVVLTKFKCPRCRHTTKPPLCSVRNPSDALATPLNVQPKLRQTHVVAYVEGGVRLSAAETARRQGRFGGRRSGNKLDSIKVDRNDKVGLKPAEENGRSATTVKRALQEGRMREGGRIQGAAQPLKAKKVPNEALEKVDGAPLPSTVRSTTANGSRGGNAPLVSPGGRKTGEKRGREAVVFPTKKKRPPLRLKGVTHPAVLRPEEVLVVAGGGPEKGPGEEGGKSVEAVTLGVRDRGCDAVESGLEASTELDAARPHGALFGGSGFDSINKTQGLRNDSVGDASKCSIEETSGQVAQPDGEVSRPLGDALAGAAPVATLKGHRSIEEVRDRTAQLGGTVSRPLGGALAGAAVGVGQNAELSNRLGPTTPTPPRKRIQPTRLDPVPQPMSPDSPGLTAGTGTAASRPEGPVAEVLPGNNRCPVETPRGPVEPSVVNQFPDYRAESPVIQRVGRYSWEAGYYQAAGRALGGGPVLPDRIHTGAASGRSSRWSIDLSKVPEVDGRKVRMAAGKIDGIEQLA